MHEARSLTSYPNSSRQYNRVVLRRLAALACSLAAISRAQDPAEILENARKKLLPMLGRISNYTCLETVERRYSQRLRPLIRNR